jgi:hypothetical protein
VNWKAAARCCFLLLSLLWNEHSESSELSNRVVWQQAARTKAAAGCRSPKGRIMFNSPYYFTWIADAMPLAEIKNKRAVALERGHMGPSIRGAIQT